MSRGPHATDLPILGPCPSDVDLEHDRERTRVFCDACRKDVHLLSHMTEAEAEDFLSTRAGERLCVSYEVDEHGAVRFKPSHERASDAPPRWRDADALVPVTRLLRDPRRDAPASSPAVRVAAAASLAVLAAACTPTTRPEETRGEAALREPPRLVISERLTNGDVLDEPTMKDPCDGPPVVPPSVEADESTPPTSDTTRPPPLRGKIKVPSPRATDSTAPKTASTPPPKQTPKRGMMVSRRLRGDVALPD